MLAACSSSDGDEPDMRQEDAAMAAPRDQGDARVDATTSARPDAAMPEPPPVVTSYAIASRQAGSYVAKITMRKLESVGSLGSMNALVTLLGIFELTPDDARQEVTLQVRYCHAELAGEGTGLLTNAGVVTPDVVMTSTMVNPVPFSANERADGTVEWSVPEVHGPVGWTWESPSDALPTSASDARVRDQDEDGNPGATTFVTLSGEPTPVYVVQTLRDTYRGTVEANGELIGTVTDRSEQAVLGSPNPLLSLASLTEQPDPNTADNIIRLKKVQDVPSCSELVEQAATLFP